MARQDYDLELTRYDGRGWRTNDTGSAFEPMPWRVPVQLAAWDALGKRLGERRRSRRRRRDVVVL